MHERILGRTGIRVSEIGFGAWGIGGELWRGNNDSESLHALHRAADLGVTFFDTALAYGDGHSERLVGKFLKERREQITVATKIPPKNARWPARPGTKLSDVFPPDHIIQCTERSLKHLGVETIDLQQLHVWLDDWADDPSWQEALRKLKEEGKIRFVGISINDHQPENAIRAGDSGLVDAFQVIYNIFDQSPERGLFPYCLQHNIGVIARVPFDEGALTGTITGASTFPPGDFRNRYFRGERRKEVEEHVSRLRRHLGPEASSLPELALRFCLHHSAVSTVIAGMRTAGHAEANCSVSDGRRLSGQLLGQLREDAWDKNFY